MLIDLLSKNFSRLRLIKREKTKTIITFVNVLNKIKYDFYYRIINTIIETKFIIYLRLHQKYIIFDFVNKKLFNQRVELFKIVEFIDKFKQTYRLKLFSIIKIYFVVFVAQLKSITLSIDFYKRSIVCDFSLIKKIKYHRDKNKIDKTSFFLRNRTITK